MTNKLNEKELDEVKGGAKVMSETKTPDDLALTLAPFKVEKHESLSVRRDTKAGPQILTSSNETKNPFLLLWSKLFRK